MKKRVIYNETKDQKVKLAFFIFLTFHPKNANLPGNNQKRTKISPQSQTKLFTVSTLYTSINRCGANMLTIVNDAFLREINLSRWYFTVNPSTDFHDKKDMWLQLRHKQKRQHSKTNTCRSQKASITWWYSISVRSDKVCTGFDDTTRLNLILYLIN